MKDLTTNSREFVKKLFGERLIQRAWLDLLWSSGNRWWTVG